MPRLALPLFLLLALIASSGCFPFSQAQLFADTYSDQGSGFSLHSPQSAVQGEVVTFDFAPDTATDYAVFSWSDGKHTYVDRSEKKDGFFRTTHVFAAGDKPRSYTVEAVAYMVRGKNDWYLDDTTHEWTCFRPTTDPADDLIGHAKITIICYRPEVDLTFTPPAGSVVKECVLTIIKDDGTRTEHLRHDKLVGPDQRGQFRVRYTPAATELNRTGETAVELLVTYSGGTQELIKHKIKTP